MAQILLVKINEFEARRLTEFLIVRGHRVTVFEPTQSLVRLLGELGQNLDLVILDVSLQGPEAGRYLEELKLYRAAHGPRPMILCVSHVYRGPRFELDLERQGARVVYVS